MLISIELHLLSVRLILPLSPRLENWKFEEWGDQVTVVSCDMREWAAPEKADIIVSELLGSFGDNELSPECLDGAQHFLKGRGKYCTSAVHLVDIEMSHYLLKSGERAISSLSDDNLVSSNSTHCTQLHSL